MSLQIRIERYLKENAVAPTSFGRLSCKDPRFVLDLRNGRQVGRKLEKRIDRFLAERV